MGSPLRLTIHGLGAEAAALAWQRVGVETEVVEQAMSRFRSDSEISRLNLVAGSASPTTVSARLYRALSASLRAWRSTGGRFDPRVLADLERLGYAGAPLDDTPRSPTVAGSPSAADRASERPLDAPWLVRRPRERRVSLSAPVDLGGIGKGLALRWAWRVLQGARPAGALLEAGGDLVAGGPSPKGGPWLVGIEDPAGDPAPVAVIAVSDAAVCTSSSRINRWRAPDGRPVHHLIDPATREPGGDGLLAVTVAGPDPAWAEVWSKALFLAGRSAIAGLARSRGLAAWWVDDDGALEMTAGARQLTAWPA